MSTKFLSDDIWPTITKAIKAKPDRCAVAVAYLGKAASRKLPLRAGSILVVDASDGAVKGGLTDPTSLLTLLRRGVEIHSVENLHAKVVVAGDVAFVGSANASQRSVDSLLEAVVRTSEKRVVTSARNFVLSLCGELVTTAHAERLAKLYRPPRAGGGKSSRPRQSKAPQHAPLWVTPLERIEWDDQELEISRKGAPVARKKLTSRSKFRIEDFCWCGGKFAKDVRAGDMVMQVINETGGIMVSPEARVLLVRRYTRGRSRNVVVFLELGKKPRRKNVATLIQRIGSQVQFLDGLEDTRLLRDNALIHALVSLWPSS